MENSMNSRGNDSFDYLLYLIDNTLNNNRALRNRNQRKSSKNSKKLGFKIYTYRVLKQVHPDCGISKEAMSIMDSFLSDIFERIASEASSLCKIVGRKTLQASDIEAATRLVLNGELGQYAVDEATKAFTEYTINQN